MTISNDSTQAREAARHSDGTFGEQHLPEPDGLTVTEPSDPNVTLVAEARRLVEWSDRITAAFQQAADEAEADERETPIEAYQDREDATVDWADYAGPQLAQMADALEEALAEVAAQKARADAAEQRAASGGFAPETASFDEQRQMWHRLSRSIEPNAAVRIAEMARSDHPDAAYLELVESDQGHDFDPGDLLDKNGNVLVRDFDDEGITSWLTLDAGWPKPSPAEMTRLGHQPGTGYTLLALPASPSE